MTLTVKVSDRFGTVSIFFYEYKKNQYFSVLSRPKKVLLKSQNKKNANVKKIVSSKIFPYLSMSGPDCHSVDSIIDQAAVPKMFQHSFKKNIQTQPSVKFLSTECYLTFIQHEMDKKGFALRCATLLHVAFYHKCALNIVIIN